MPEAEIKTLLQKLSVLTDHLDRLCAESDGPFTRKEACDMLGICLKTFKSYWQIYRLPVADPRARKAVYSRDELELCLKILRNAGKKLRHAKIHTF